jgi:hypothetical protein
VPEIVHQLEAEAVVVLMVERKPLRVLKESKISCGNLSIMSKSFNSPLTVQKARILHGYHLTLLGRNSSCKEAKRKRFQLAKNVLEKKSNKMRHNHSLTHLIYSRVRSKKPNSKCLRSSFS